MAIIIKNMKKLPKTCLECEFHTYEYDSIFNFDYCVCNIEKNCILCDEKTQKPTWCPLEEVK